MQPYDTARNKEKKKDVTQKLLLELEQKSFFFWERDQATLFSALVLPGASSEGWKKKKLNALQL